jgi:hypothetical protein
MGTPGCCDTLMIGIEILSGIRACCALSRTSLNSTRQLRSYVQCNHLRELVDGTMTIVPGINFLPWDILAFIDDSIDHILTPFSGPYGDYEGAVRRAEHANAQQAFYKAYIKGHGIKVETVFLPNGKSTLFCPVSAWQADAGIAAMLNLNAFFVLVQGGQFFSPAGAEVLFTAFGDLVFNLGHQCIQPYYSTCGCCAVD